MKEKDYYTSEEALKILEPKIREIFRKWKNKINNKI